ncbi:catalytic protein [Colletotrichum truncatum]|uniref:Catalytic protein n=1 Tax=Colletotrichum truncatum TaxID=5467 RepID=A0ACC3ZIW4_COLTU|nr:catalytic protein [Colletotrichum truncatum]KAF6791810.1 catalytic protein [Colletotrichum truncatum]
MPSYQDDEPSSSSAPPPPYSVYAPSSGSGDLGSTSSFLHPPGQAPEKGSHSASANSFGILDSKRRLADPRSSSAQSLAPSFEDRDSDTRRTLLIIYIHGFYGNESSFRSFPAHVHNYLKEALAESHAVHSKIYPRYKTYKAIDVARDNFSQWLEPHESDKTDVILVGHSMGGLLAGEVALMPNRHPYRRQPFKHRILGTVSLDSPFLGLHPGIVVAGISSLFRPASPTEETHDQLDASSHLSPSNSAMTSPDPSMSNLELTSSFGTQLSPSPSNTPSVASSNGPPPRTDPFFNPPFFNDTKFKDRSFMRRLGHFAKKHSAEGIWDATKNHVMSHLEYGGCLADYPGLNARYNKLRALENVDPLQHLRENSNSGNSFGQPPLARVRFINYYTLSTGRPKKPKSPKSPESPDRELPTGPPSTLDIASQLSPQAPSTPRISVNSDDGDEIEILHSIEVVDAKLSTLHEEQQARFDHESDKAVAKHGQEPVVPEHTVEPKGKGKETSDHEIESSEAPKKEVDGQANGGDTHVTDASGDVSADPELPPIPDLPEPPTLPDLDRYTDKDARKQAEKEAKRVQKAYEQAVKSRDKAIKERQKLVEKRRKKAEKDALKETQRLQKEEQKAKQQGEAAQKKQEKEKEKEEEKEAPRQEPAQVTAAVEDASGASSDEQDGPLMMMEPIPMSEEYPAPQASPAPERPPPPPTSRGPPPPLPPRMPSTAPASSSASIATTQTDTRAPEGPSKPKKERKFCTLPRKINGRRDETWVPVFMEGVDEVGAHCGLFVPGPHYDRLIGDVGGRILGWVQEDMTARAILEMS